MSDSLRLLTTAQVMERLAIKSRETLRKLQRECGFPLPLHQPGSLLLNYWLEHEVDEYVKRCVATRDAEAPNAGGPLRVEITADEQ